jgi:hypothetical protein
MIFPKWMTVCIVGAVSFVIVLGVAAAQDSLPDEQILLAQGNKPDKADKGKKTQPPTTQVPTATSTCGNAMVEASEQCDGMDLQGHTCVDKGYVMGTLACKPDCTFDETGCSATAQ